MQSPFIFPQDSDDFLPISLNLWDETDNFLNPCWKPPKFSPAEEISSQTYQLESGKSDVIAKVNGHHHVPFKSLVLDPDSVAAGRTILLLGIMGIVFFLIFMINLLIWVKRMKKVNILSYIHYVHLEISRQIHTQKQFLKKWTKPQNNVPSRCKNQVHVPMRVPQPMIQ